MTKGESMKSKKETVILIDIDDVLTNMVVAWLKRIEEKYGVHRDYEDIQNWDMQKAYPELTKEEIYSVLYEEEFWDTVETKPDAIEYVRKLHEEGYQIYFCTASFCGNLEPKFKHTIERDFPYIKWENIILSSNKKMIIGDFLVDDNIDNLVDGVYKGILVDTPYNRSLPDIYLKKKGITRVTNWKQIYDIITHSTYEESDTYED